MADLKMAPGNWVQCVDAGSRNTLTVGKPYLVVESLFSSYSRAPLIKVVADDGQIHSFYEKRFKLILEEDI